MNPRTIALLAALTLTAHAQARDVDRLLDGLIVTGDLDARVAAARERADRRWLARVYLDLLGRPLMDGEGGAHLAFASANGRVKTVRNIVDADESRRALVKRFYRELLDRDASDEEAAFHAGAWRDHKLTAEQLRVNILDSREFLEKPGDGTGGPFARFLNNLYRKTFGRDCDPLGQATHGPALENGTPRAPLIRLCVIGPETARRRVREYYRRFLDRDPSEDEIASHVPPVGNLMPAEEDHLAAFLGSDEYARRANAP